MREDAATNNHLRFTEQGRAASQSASPSQTRCESAVAEKLTGVGDGCQEKAMGRYVRPAFMVAAILGHPAR